MRRIVLVLMIAFLLSGCYPSGPSVRPTEVPTQSLRAVPQILATIRPSPTVEPAPTAESTQPQPQYVTAVLLGFDGDREGIGMRSDTFIIITLRVIPGKNDRKIDEVVVLSIPRDTLVDVKTDAGWVKDRINVAYLRGGFDGVRQAVEFNFGIFVNAGIYGINFDQFIKIADILGGLTVVPKQTYFDWCGDYKGLLKSGKGGYDRNWKANVEYDMSGAELLCYVRARAQSDDVDRTRRAQDVLAAMARDWLPSVIISPTIWPDLFSLTRSDLDLPSAMALVPLADDFATGGIPLRMASMRIGEELKYGKTESGASVLIPLVDLKQWAACEIADPISASALGCP